MVAYLFGFYFAETRISICIQYVKFHQEAENLQNEFENLESLLKASSPSSDDRPIEEKWEQIQKLFYDLQISGQDFIDKAKQVSNFVLKKYCWIYNKIKVLSQLKDKDPYLDMNRAILCVETILDNLGKRKLVITDLHSHYHMKISISKELNTLWKSYKEKLIKVWIWF